MIGFQKKQILDTLMLILIIMKVINLIILNRIKKIKNSYKLDKTANQIVQI